MSYLSTRFQQAQEGQKFADTIVKQLRYDAHYVKVFTGGGKVVMSGMLGSVYQEAGNYKKAYALVSDAISEADDSIQPAFLNHGLRVLIACELSNKKPNLKRVHANLQKLFKILKENNLNVYIPRYYYYLSEYHLKSNDVVKAKKAIKKSIELLEKNKMSGWLEKALAKEKEIAKKV